MKPPFFEKKPTQTRVSTGSRAGGLNIVLVLMCEIAISDMLTDLEPGFIAGDISWVRW